jgi:anaerobic ribonucleoside-triphosphate reductase activating protein
MGSPDTSTGLSININRLHFPVSSLGFGQRLAIWVQGCSLHCPGCISRDTWQHGSGSIQINQLLENLERWLEQADGLTVSGGEPFEQPDALLHLLRWWKHRHAGDILVFSGFPWERLQKRHAALLELIDVLISDPYEAAAGHELPLRGSDNQRMHKLSALGRSRYEQLTTQRSLDLCWDGNQLWMAGIPRPDDISALHDLLRRQGVEFHSSDQELAESSDQHVFTRLEVLP